jgi:hypothetical protein
VTIDADCAAENSKEQSQSVMIVEGMHLQCVSLPVAGVSSSGQKVSFKKKILFGSLSPFWRPVSAGFLTAAIFILISEPTAWERFQDFPSRLDSVYTRWLCK